jgi:hypothetical protein
VRDHRSAALALNLHREAMKMSTTTTTVAQPRAMEIGEPQRTHHIVPRELPAPVFEPDEAAPLDPEPVELEPASA